MTFPATRIRRYGSATGSLLAAYLVVFQIAALGLAGVSAMLGPKGVTGEELCASTGEKRSADKPGGPASSHGLAKNCCLAHGLGAGAPPAEGAFEGLIRFAVAAAPSLRVGSDPDKPWPTLPVGSRAPPAIQA